jgi:hypothetical protein
LLRALEADVLRTARRIAPGAAGTVSLRSH